MNRIGRRVRAESWCKRKATRACRYGQHTFSLQVFDTGWRSRRCAAKRADWKIDNIDSKRPRALRVCRMRFEQRRSRRMLPLAAAESRRRDRAIEINIFELAASRNVQVCRLCSHDAPPPGGARSRSNSLADVELLAAVGPVSGGRPVDRRLHHVLMSMHAWRARRAARDCTVAVRRRVGRPDENPSAAYVVRLLSSGDGIGRCQ